jgi:hypothetical protein
MNLSIPMKTIFRKILLTAVCLAAAFTVSSQAALLLYDGMESYTPGAGISGLNGGTAAGGASWSAYSTASAGQTIESATLSYSGGTVLVNGGTNAYFSNSGAATFQTLRDYTIPAVSDGGSIFVSYLMNSPGSFNGDNTFTQVGLYPSQNWGAVTYLSGGDTQLGVRAGSGSNIGGTANDLQDGVTYFVVQQYQISGANTIINTWLNPTSLTLGTPDTTSTGTSMTFTQLRIRGALTTGSYYFDEFRVGTSIADVVPVPEPAALSLILLGGAGAAVFRRRSRG